MADTVLRPECCATCAENPKSGRLRYCAPNRCYCGHKACPAYASYVNLRPMPANVTPIAPGSRVERARAKAS